MPPAIMARMWAKLNVKASPYPADEKPANRASAKIAR